MTSSISTNAKTARLATPTSPNPVSPSSVVRTAAWQPCTIPPPLKPRSSSPLPSLPSPINVPLASIASRPPRLHTPKAVPPLLRPSLSAVRNNPRGISSSPNSSRVVSSRSSSPPVASLSRNLVNPRSEGTTATDAPFPNTLE
ncbi:hypothetical protein BG015_000370 [Linnemannia schmuckeri]|uniref:Uncharacterized protein n=1 Tax=Linnemannia schmuckeri TaxID=64567 RepID=A0A9P5V754_9FUNG|nr:hypothetical protein BG015_000370 [Linnemannia schmuckeri]